MSFIVENAEAIGLVFALIWNLFLQKTKAPK